MSAKRAMLAQRILSVVFCAITLAATAIVSRDHVAKAESAPKAVDASCTLEPGAIHTVAKIVDGETVQLDDGSEVRLIGALAPRAGDVGAAKNAWPAESYAVRTLTELVLGRSVKLTYGGRKTDRYGRHLAHLFLTARGEAWVQGEMLAAGAARAYGLPGNFLCAKELLAHEQIARSQSKGLWDTAVYRAKPARLVALLLSRRSYFEIVEGTVASVGRTKSAAYLNFGSDWKTDFTARVAKEVLAAHPEWDAALTDLTGKTVAVRGWIERRNGPMIDVRDPSQLEIGAPSVGAPAPLEPTAPPNAAESVSSPLAPETDSSGDDANEKRPAAPETEPPGAANL